LIKTGLSPQKAYVLHPRGAGTPHQADYELEEALGLTEALELECSGGEVVPLREIRANTYFAGGKIDEVKAIVEDQNISVIVVNASLSPIQQRNLERAWQAKVIDRQGLILEIFALRAATKEGRLQVELARQAYERSRLVRTWTHLERQRGGRGFLAGPGERQIESDRRMLDERITRLKRQLEDVRRTRGLQRQKRERAPERVVALVGYTNAGKSTIFNALTEGGVLAKDMLFATLDTTLRILTLPNGKPAILSDTVGFISNLPTDLIAAFQATLEEVKLADLLVHVRDIADPLSDQRRDDVLDVLDQIGAGPTHDQPTIEVWNKADLLEPGRLQELEDIAESLRAAGPDATACYMVSAQSGMGLEDLCLGIETHLSQNDRTLMLDIAPQDYAARAWLFEHGDVLQETPTQDGHSEIVVRLTDVDAGRFRQRFSSVIALSA
jgi:GTP-binding protein HflX